MANVTGNAGKNFIHRAGDLQTSPAGYSDITGVTTGNDVVYGLDGTDILFGDAGDDVLNGGTGNDTMTGGTGNDTLNDEAGNDVLDGSAGVDTMTGGTGNDTYYVDNAGDKVFEATGGGTDTVYSTVSWAMAAGQQIENLRAYGTGTTLGVTFTGNELANDLVGGSGKDVLNGGDGIDTLGGGAGNDTLDGGAGKDRLDGGAGADTMTGGTGNDIYYVDNAGDKVFEAAGGGTDTVYAAVNWAMAAGQQIEYLRAYGTAAASSVSLTGNEFSNYLFGGSSGDVLNGGGGKDTMKGGTGNDTYYVDNADDKVFESSGGGTDIVYSTVSWTMAAGQQIESLSAYGAGAASGVSFTGNELANSLVGGSGGDVLNGGGGVDTMKGGTGNDTYYVDNADDKVFESSGGGTDTVYSAVSWAMAAGQQIEYLRVNGAGATSGVAFTGNELANYLVGGSGGDVLNGGGGSDTMTGGTGDDTYYVDNAGDKVLELADGGTDTVYSAASWAMAAGQQIEYLRSGTTSGITLAGNELANYLVGGSGGDVLNGGGGIDTMKGGTGNDTYYVDNAADKVFESSGGGTDTVYSTVSWTMAAGQQIESLRSGTTSGITLTGNALANYLGGGGGNDVLNGGNGSDTLDGGAGNDVLNGGGGSDAMTGGTGNDTYYVDNAGDKVFESSGGGTDTVYSTVSWAMAAGQQIESLRAETTSGITLTGNELANYLAGGSGNDVLNGGSGIDTLDGGAGNDVLNGGGGSDTMTGGAGNDTYYVDNAGDKVFESSGGGADTVYSTVNWAMAAGQQIEHLRAETMSGIALTGNELANHLVGGDGNDVLNGGDGKDTLAGGAGLDTFLFDTPLAGNVDTVADFNASDDKIRLDRSIFTAITALGTLSAAAFSTGAAAHDADDRIIYNSATGNLFYDSDGIGAAAAVQFAHLTGAPSIVNTNFSVVA